MVIGGGLLGLRRRARVAQIGLEVRVAHLVGHLMEMQCDEAAGEIVRRAFERMGIGVLLRHAAEEIIGGKNGSVEGVRFSNGDAYEADLVVISTGIRPNAALARDAGLAVNRGIVVNDYMETIDPDILAVGECVEHRGKMYGLVAPLMEQARTAAVVLSGDRSLPYKGSQTSAKLKVAGIDVVSMGNFMSDGAGCEEIVFSDPGAGLYQKVVVQGARRRRDPRRRHPPGRKAQALLRSGEDVTLSRAALLRGDSAPIAVADLPDDALVCGCMGVAKGTIVDAIEAGCASREAVAEKTRACTSCKSCGPTIDQLLQNVLGGEYVKADAAAKPFCACVPSPSPSSGRRSCSAASSRSRRCLALSETASGARRAGRGSRTLSPRSGGTGTSRSASTGSSTTAFTGRSTRTAPSPLCRGCTRASRRRRSSGVSPRSPRSTRFRWSSSRAERGSISSASTRPISRASGLTSGCHRDTRTQRRSGRARRAWAPTSANSGVADSLGAAVAMEKAFEGLYTPHKVKMAVSGCPRNCVEATVKDIGLVGIQGAWEIYVGGAAGMSVRKGDLLATVATREEAIEISARYLQFYRERPTMRRGRTGSTTGWGSRRSRRPSSTPSPARRSARATRRRRPRDGSVAGAGRARPSAPVRGFGACDGGGVEDDGRRGGRSMRTICVGRIADIPEGEGKAVKVLGREYAVFRDGGSYTPWRTAVRTRAGRSLTALSGADSLPARSME